MKRRKLLLLGLLVLLGTLILQAPASLLIHWLAPTLSSAGVQLQGVSGALASGRAARVDYQGRPLVGELGWQLSPLQLLIGRASFMFTGGSDGLLVDGTAFVVPSGTLTLSDFRLAGPLRTVAAAAGQAFVPAEGQVVADIDTLKLRSGWPVKAEGSGTLRNVVWKLGRDPVALGDYQARLETETAGIKLTISTLSGALEVGGEARVNQDHSYEIHIQMRPRADAPPELANLVRGVGQPDSQGWHHFRQSVKAPATAGEPPQVLPAP